GQMGQMAAEQEALRRALGELMAAIGEAGAQIPRSLGEAELAMRAARDALQQGQAGQALDPEAGPRPAAPGRPGHDAGDAAHVRPGSGPDARPAVRPGAEQPRSARPLDVQPGRRRPVGRARADRARSGQGARDSGGAVPAGRRALSADRGAGLSEPAAAPLLSAGVRQRWSPNADNRPSGSAIDALILHYTGMPSAAAAVNRLCDPAAKVSAHYLIDEDGSVVQLVPEERRAWHAGVSEWQGRPGLNDCSIGIELVNPGHEWGYRPFTEAQYEACIALCRAILERWPIPPGRVLAHSDVAPARKQDPGELF